MKKKDKHIFKNLVFVLVAVMCVGMFTSNTVQAKGKVAINKTKVTVCTKKSYTLKITNASKKVKWTTSDKKNLKIKPSGKKNENCKVTTSNKKGTATVTAKVGKKKYTTKVKVAGHKYGKASYKWNSDYSKCTASKKCSRCGKTLKQTVKASSKTTTKATCTEAGTKKYTAKFTKYGFGTKNKSVSIKMKSHSVDSNKKISYKWNKDYLKCTATFYCKVGGEKQTETVKSTKQVTPATKTSEGKEVYTATFKTKGLKKQTYTHKLDTLCYLDKTNVTLKAGSPVTINLKNKNGCQYDVYQIEFDGEPDAGETYVWSNKSESMERVKNITCKWGDGSITLSTIKPVPNKTYTVRLSTLGQTLECKVTTVFTPGDYTFGKIGFSYTNQGYMGWGKYKGKYPNSAEYVEYCGDKEKYDKYKSFFDNQTLRDGTTGTLEDLAAQTRDACGERANYATEYSSKIQEEAKAKGYRAGKIHEYFNSLKAEDSTIQYEEDYYTFWENGFEGCSEQGYTNTQINSIVSNWVKYRNNGEWPSWCYASCYKDWCEWSGHTYIE